LQGEGRGGGLGVLAGGVQPGAGVRLQPVESEPLLLHRVLPPGLFEVLDDRHLEPAGDGLRLAGRFRGGAFFVGGEDTVRREAFDGERAADADAPVVLVRLVVEQFGVGVAGDGDVNLLLPLAAQPPPLGV
jgi:hypothetical protein